jgi:hypothetical protein
MPVHRLVWFRLYCSLVELDLNQLKHVGSSLEVSLFFVFKYDFQKLFCKETCHFFTFLFIWSSQCYYCRNIIHGSDGPETAKDEIKLWFKPEELVSFTSNSEKWIYGDNWTDCVPVLPSTWLTFWNKVFVSYGNIELYKPPLREV